MAKTGLCVKYYDVLKVNCFDIFPDESPSVFCGQVVIQEVQNAALSASINRRSRTGAPCSLPGAPGPHSN